MTTVPKRLRLHLPQRIKVMKLMATLLAFIGIGGFAAGFICVFVTLFNKPMVSTWARFPLGRLKCVAVDSNGNIYCGLTFYSRIQAYSLQGQFLRGWFTTNGGGVFDIMIDNNDYVHVARGNHRYTYNTNGLLLSNVEQPNNDDLSIKDHEYYLNMNSYQAPEDRQNNLYLISSRMLIVPTVVKILPTGDKLTVVSDPFYLWFIGGPFPAFIWIFAGGLLYQRLEKHR